ncbi:MAG: sn-glycerol-3-phosphate-binding periplasmic protein UgpB precursor [Chloroflexi bacterium ADurb.Bin120]|jgi:multiple sugar transport system substrate-binding protein|uniref:Carbohydrate ABC transporter substrate-binding protein, CUT1 family n=1 Tax=Candidatus Brevifilum fermentans TaxID=1986204 RepID=A0A1Y6K6J4_9CHLR|nr:ABC transporter substrate-binding protein [Brevefilum fermentans]OQB83820.1 MAG: sn-glycerol-3-phosphate-binding periplasmic protein UgpB precursor [Chloroflexi bacterium ADurb.Bin120]SMX55301.1 Carbohydrate ABC transporter substrate-binding protein, CUT1 family [Brevefilum fermentans]HOM66789.1 ABC transporter substrate-binding protein [Brevefilum fermentans]
MLKTKKHLLLLVVLIALLTVAACSGKPAEAPVEPDAPETEKEWPAVTIEYWHINNETFGLPAIRQLIEEFNATNGKNITVVEKFIPDVYTGVAQNLQASLAAGIYPGVVQVGYVYLNYFADNFPQFTDPQTVIEKYAPEDAGFLDEIYSEAVLALGTSISGRTLGMPYSVSTPLLYYNADLFREAGLDPDNPPATWDEVRAAAEAIKEKTGLYGLYLQAPTDTYNVIPIMLSNGLDEMYQINADGTYAAAFNTPETIEAWTFIQEMTSDGLNIHVPLEEGVGAFAGGTVGMMITTSGRINYLMENTEFDVRATYHPTWGDKDRKVCIGGNLLVIVAENEDDILASWEWLKFIFKPESIALWTQGTGYLPPTKTAVESVEIKEWLDSNPMASIAYKQLLSDAVPWTSWPGPNGLQVDQYLVDMRDAILSNFDDVQTAVDDAESKINTLLNQ